MRRRNRTRRTRASRTGSRPLGVKARDVLPLAMNLTGEPATALFTDWPAVEKRLTKKLLAFSRVYFVGKATGVRGHRGPHEDVLTRSPAGRW